MVKLTEEMKSVFSKVKLFPVATASKDGIPNVAPIAFVQLVSDDTLWIGDNYMVKTLSNVKENPHLSVYIYDPEVKRCFQIKGKVEVRSSGPDFEKMKGIIKAKNEKYPAKTLLVVKITDVFECTPGATAGKKML
ncbi:MAG: pyridoxamine 5'-phosphate oxidase family protein [Methanomicrobiales archaeon]|nr:pyridoxamine 5'-phosphate oxidase family protein [Methanomicrobiales archaeon]